MTHVVHGRYSNVDTNGYIRKTNRWERGIQVANREKKSIIAERCWFNCGSQAWVYIVKYNTGCRTSLSEKWYSICKKYNINRNSRCIEKICKPRFICYTFLINENLFNIPDIKMISYILDNYQDSIKEISYFHEYDLINL
jgi:hypothetical protein